ncbi:hypothetical protein GCM10023085_31820 [Actinomadura viridis]|uniref:Acetylornithine deacetylase/succinyl-diaminopimelate desuccinylase-like protein n=1 Tax=Actinomadura viridis TaxID=58110 RepID=A0A931D9D4_9ACTN|nr:M20/M25/M40 family metallo-hydrolase [Actinomadura viridis]MBG6086864.1 acetylornithine deacetylase/succinyl-diaminopimelate desuccinylase-like protein [Actinomadura viridis]
MIEVELTPADRELLLGLLRVPTVGLLEEPEGTPGLWEAQSAYADAAAELGFTTVLHGPPKPEVLDRPGVPEPVRRAAAELPGFLDRQPSLVLRLGPPLPRERTVMFNVHLDTVAGWEPPRFEDGRFHGRGAIDAKGPAVGLLTGIRAALAAEPALGDEVGVLIQAVAGEEGGAMGTFGTRPLVEDGHVGRLNVFCEPTGLRWLPRSTASMTACVRVDGRDAIDDEPDAGHNATVLLGFLAQHLAAELPAAASDGRVCVAGLHTGDLHNRVYGSGRLLLNISYGSPEGGRRMERALDEALASGLAAFARTFAPHRDQARTAADAEAITTLEWLKRGLPALAGSDPWAEELLERRAGLVPWPAGEPAFTCDAIWMQDVPGAFTVVYGPGDLGANNAHAAGEHADAADLEHFAAGVARLLTSFTRSRSEHP